MHCKKVKPSLLCSTSYLCHIYIVLLLKQSYLLNININMECEYKRMGTWEIYNSGSCLSQMEKKTYSSCYQKFDLITEYASKSMLL